MKSLVSGLTITRLRLAGSAPRAMIETALASFEAEALDLPRRAVLFVPRLTPHGRLRRSDPAAFGRAVAAALQEKRRGARRPNAADGASALLFENETEFLAWVLGGWLRREPEQSSLLKMLARPQPPEAFTRELLQHGEVLPVLFDRMAASGDLLPFVTCLSPVEAQAAAAAVAIAHALVLPTRHLDVSSALPAKATSQPRERRLRDSAMAAASPAVTAARAVAPEACAPGLGAEGQGLILLALGLARDPIWVRTAAAVGLVAAALNAVPLAKALDRSNSSERSSIAALSSPRGQSSLQTSAPSPLLRSEHQGVAGRSSNAPHEDHSHSAVASRQEHPNQGSLVPSHDILLERNTFRIRTDLGGLLFVLVLLLRLNLYAEFSAPLGTNLPIAPWLLLRRLGRRWFRRSVVKDPLDALLHDLAGCRAGATPPRMLRSPIAAIDVSIRDAASRSLGMAGTAALSLLCRREARLTITPGSLDAEFPLEHHPIEIRLAGLDRDPGWIPAAGRSVAFHFL